MSKINKGRSFTLINGQGEPLICKKTGRNAMCRCGSGKKNKNCCNITNQYFLSPTVAMKKKKEELDEAKEYDIIKQLLMENGNYNSGNSE